ncbi:MAG TPA: DinB family protein [Candidatus Limnocylindria bacterium]|nr:DinB family protein [Candidatus Limnocylindria bacterium]
MTKTVTQAVEELVRAMAGLSDADMGRAWKWRDYDEEGLRFALLMTHHELRDLAARLASRREREPSETERILAQYHQAYRDLTGVLAAVRTEDLDTPPEEGQWPVRDVAAHMLGAEWGFLAVNRFALERQRAGNAIEPSGDEFRAFQAPYREQRIAAEAAVAAGAIGEIRNAFFDVHRRVLRELAGVTDAELAAPAWFWENEAMPIRFRLHRFEAHLRQHTIQLDKTLAVVRPPTEAHRLVRNIYNALADVEMEDASADDVRAAVAGEISTRAATIAASVSSAA